MQFQRTLTNEAAGGQGRITVIPLVHPVFLLLVPFYSMCSSTYGRFMMRT
jgi:hypothetical protein